MIIIFKNSYVRFKHAKNPFSGHYNLFLNMSPGSSTLNQWLLSASAEFNMVAVETMASAA
jgi:hypothetical protein